MRQRTLDLVKKAATDEMAAYDELPAELRAVFDGAPRKVSVIKTMGLPGVKKAYLEMPLPRFVSVLRDHLAQQAAQEAHVST